MAQTQDPPRKPNDHPCFALLMQPDVRKVIRAKLRDLHIPEHELDQLEADVIDETYEWIAKLIARGEDPPDTPVRMKGAVRDVARNVAVDWIKRHKQNAEACAQPCANAEVIGAAPEANHDPNDVKKALGVWNEMERNEHADSLMDARAAGDGVSEAGRELGIGAGRAHNIEEKTREKFVRRMKVLGLVALLPTGLAVWFLFIHDASVKLEGHRDNFARTVEHHLGVEGGEDDPDSLRQRAAELRQRAKTECAAGQWVQCRDDNDLADRLDPAGAPFRSAKPGFPQAPAPKAPPRTPTGP